LTDIVQVALAASAPPEIPTLVPPPVARTEPPHVVAALGAAAMKMPAGNGSIRARAVSADAAVPVFETVMVSVDVPPSGMIVGAKALASPTFAALPTFSVALATVVLLTPCVVISAPIGMVLT
jgi:hypothetical protein